MKWDRAIWDEFQWEEFIAAEDRMRERCLELVFRNRFPAGKCEQFSGGWGWCAWQFAEDEEEGDEWKRSVPQERLLRSDFESVQLLPVYRRAKEFCILATGSVEKIPEAYAQNSTVVDFLSNASVIAAGLAMGSKVGELAGNIAYCKRALLAANLVLEALRELKNCRIISLQQYDELVREATELRNDVALYIIELRHQFCLGI